MTSNHDPEPRELDDKEEKSNDSSLADEENSRPDDHEGEHDVEDATEADEKSAAPPKSNDPGPPPNGGLKAWLQVLGGFMLFFNTWGVLK